MATIIIEQEITFEEAQRICEKQGLVLIMCLHADGETTIYASK